MKKSIIIVLFAILFITGCLQKNSENEDDGLVWKVKDITSEEVINATVEINSPFITDSYTDNMVDVKNSGYFTKMGIVPLKYGQKNLIGYLAPDFTKKNKYTISGSVKNGDTNGTINEAFIAVSGNFISKKTKTDINGAFEIKDIPEGNIEITVYKEGYTSKTTSLILSSNISGVDKTLTEDSTKTYGDIIGSVSGYGSDICSYSYITVGINGSDFYKTTFSDVNGNFAVYGVPYNSYIISCKTPGFYKVNSSTVTVSSAINSKSIEMTTVSGE